MTREQCIRERATLICALAAVGGEAMCNVLMALNPRNSWSLLQREIWDLAHAARVHAVRLIVEDVPSRDLYRLSCIRAAILLRGGWSP